MNLKISLALGLLISTTIYADNTLRSEPLKKSICSNVESDLYRYDDAISFDLNSCTKGSFVIAGSTRDPRTNIVTLMKINYSFKLGQIAVTGNAQLAASSMPDNNGRMTTTWTVRSTQSSFKDPRDIVQMIREELDLASDNDRIDMHNGDFDIASRPGFGLREARRNLSQALENGSCKYETTSGIDYVLGDFYLNEGIGRSKLPDLLRRAKAQKKIKAAVMREYEDGESEYCSHYYYYIIFTDGTVLNFNMDLTT